MYSTSSGGTALYDSGSCAVIPDTAGAFKVTLGASGCGNHIPESFFEDNAALYLGIKIGKDKEISTRQRIPNTALAQSAQFLQGLPVGTSTSSIPFISDAGIIKLTNVSPVIRSTAEVGSLKLQSASELIMESGKSSDVNIVAGENGSIHFRTKNNGIDNMLISSDGNVSVGGSTPGLFKLEVGGSLGPSLDSIYDLGSSAKNWNTLYVNKVCFNTVLDCIEGGYSDYWVTGDGTIAPVDEASDLLVGSTATESAHIKFSASAGNSSFIRSGYFGIGTTAPISALHVEGALTLTGNITDITTSNNENLTLAAHGTGFVVINDAVRLGSDSKGVYVDGNGVLTDLDGSLVIADDVYLGSESYGIKISTNGEITDSDGLVTITDDLSVAGNLTGGTSGTSGTTTIDIGGTGTGNALCHTTADGIDNEGIVDCTSSPTADFAEMYPVEVGTGYGDVVALSTEVVTTSDGRNIRKLVRNNDAYNTKLIGIVSDNYGDFISVGHNVARKDNPMPVALKGRVPVRVDPASSPFHAGDFLTGSSRPGRAIKAELPGMMIGQALEDWTPQSQKETIMVFVQTAYADPSPARTSWFSFARDALKTVSGSLFVENAIESPVVRTDQLIADNITSEYIYSPVVESDTVKPGTIRARVHEDISIALDDNKKTASGEGDLARLVIKGLQDRPVATIDAEGNIAAAGGIAAKDATISGTLAAKEVVADNITALQDRLERTVRKTEDIDRLGSDMNAIQQSLSHIRDEQLASVSAPLAGVPDSFSNPVIADGLYSNLVVSGTANIFQLSVYDTVSALADELKLNALASINFLDGAAVLTKDGTLTLNGALIAKSGIRTGDIRPAEDGTDIRAHLTANDSGNSALKIQNQLGATVAQVDASGSAMFRSITLGDTNIATESAIIAAADNFAESGQFTPAINSKKAAAGSAIIPPQEKEIIIYNEAVKESSLIYLTPAGNDVDSPVSVAEKVACPSTDGNTVKPCKPYFKVATQEANDTHIAFNWLIIN